MCVFLDTTVCTFAELLWGDFDIDKMSQDPLHSTINFHLEHLGVWLYVDQSHRINNPIEIGM